MKKILLSLFLGCASMLSAQELVGTLSDLPQTKLTKFEMNYSNVQIDKMSEADYLLKNPKWTKQKASDMKDFYNHFTDQVEDRLVVDKTANTDYLIRVDIVTVSKKGSYLCNVYVLKAGEVIATIAGVKGEDADTVGEDSGSIMKKGLKQAAKK